MIYVWILLIPFTIKSNSSKEATFGLMEAVRNGILSEKLFFDFSFKTFSCSNEIWNIQTLRVTNWWCFRKSGINIFTSDGIVKSEYHFGSSKPLNDFEVGGNT